MQRNLKYWIAAPYAKKSKMDAGNGTHDIFQTSKGLAIWTFFPEHWHKKEFVCIYLHICCMYLHCCIFHAYFWENNALCSKTNNLHAFLNLATLYISLKNQNCCQCIFMHTGIFEAYLLHIFAYLMYSA